MTAGFRSTKKGRFWHSQAFHNDWEDDEEEEPSVGWSPYDTDPEIQLEYDNRSHLYCRAGCTSTPSRAWIGVRGRPGIVGGNYMFEIKVLGSDDLVRVGWTPADSSRAVGSEVNSFGYGGTGKKSHANRFQDYARPFGQGDTVGCIVNRSQRFIAFTLNGHFLGRAHSIPSSLDGVPLFPTVCAREAFLVAGYFGGGELPGGGLPFGYRDYWPVGLAEEEDRADPSYFQSLGDAQESEFDSNDLAARAKREKRFEAPSIAVSKPTPVILVNAAAVATIRKVGSIDLSSFASSGQARSTIVQLPTDRSRSPLLVRTKSSTGEKPLQGLSEDVERPYVRFTAIPRAVDIRPVRVLLRSFELVKQRWATEKDWIWAGEMLRSIRQDLTVQMVRTPFAVEVYEFCARTALEVGDFKQFDQCSTQLEELHAALDLGTTSHEAEFLAYRLLYLLLQGDAGIALSTFLQRRGGEIRKQVSAGHPYLAEAWCIRTAVSAGRLPKRSNTCGKVEAATTQSLGSAYASLGLAFVRLSSLLLEKGQLRRLAALCHSVKPAVTRTFLQRLGIEAGTPMSHIDDEVPQFLPVKFRPKDLQLVDASATIAEVERQLSSKEGRGGQRVRLGKQSSDHARHFVRTLSV